ncbi:MAG TPA: hypothetical protein PK970_07200 [Hyphomicrobiaceae bacterium]|nr:hypothetical protein [Hyphomicrobiaceae bacterium]
MSLRAIPLIILPFVLYFIIGVLGGGPVTDETFRKVLFRVPLVNNTQGGWAFSWGDLIILITMICLFIELIKSTYTQTVSMIDHGLSMVVFILCLIAFLMMPQAQTSVFFFVMVAALIDVVAGFMIGIRTARRDLNIGGHD